MIWPKFPPPKMHIISAHCAKSHHVAMSRQPLPRLSEWSRSEIRCTLPHWNFTFTCWIDGSELMESLNWWGNAANLPRFKQEIQDTYAVLISCIFRVTTVPFDYVKCLWSFCVAGFCKVRKSLKSFPNYRSWGGFSGFGVRSISHLCNECMTVYRELWQVCSDLGRFVHAQKCRCSTRRRLGIPFGVDL